MVEDDEGQEYELHSVNSVRVGKAKTKPLVISLVLNDTPSQMKIDTSAAVTIITEQAYQTISGFRNKPALEPSTCILRTYTEERVEVLGQVQLTVWYGTQQHTLQAQVAPGKQPNLMGRDWLAKIKLNWQEVFGIQAEKQKSNSQQGYRNR